MVSIEIFPISELSLSFWEPDGKKVFSSELILYKNDFITKTSQIPLNSLLTILWNFSFKAIQGVALKWTILLRVTMDPAHVSLIILKYQKQSKKVTKSAK